MILVICLSSKTDSATVLVSIVEQLHNDSLASRADNRLRGDAESGQQCDAAYRYGGWATVSSPYFRQAIHQGEHVDATSSFATGTERD